VGVAHSHWQKQNCNFDLNISYLKYEYQSKKIKDATESGVFVQLACLQSVTATLSIKIMIFEFLLLLIRLSYYMKNHWPSSND
jgi:hypothetical protein